MSSEPSINASRDLLYVPSVSELTEDVKSILESNFSDILVGGEISNVNRSRNGHYYFTVKDDGAQLPCVIWKGVAERLNIDLEDGQQVILGGDIQVYAPHGRYQLIVSLVQQAGIGQLQKAFEKLKNKLQNEGLFDSSLKKPVPSFPTRIGVITSATGAAFQDIRSTLEKRWPLAHIYLFHASVQGVRAAPELVHALEWFTARENVDLIIIGRGGGSLEDLWPFNEESVARAIFNCPLPVISAVGHETDFSISDFVADLRAATPTQAAVLAVPDIRDVRLQMDDYSNRMARSIQDRTVRMKEKIITLSRSHALLVIADKMKRYRETVNNYQSRLKLGIRSYTEQNEKVIHLNHELRFRMDKLLTNRSNTLTSLTHKLEKQNPHAPLEKGYVRVWQGDKWIQKPESFSRSKPFDLEWKESRQTMNN